MPTAAVSAGHGAPESAGADTASSPEGTLRRRYHFLVYEGPSRLGKTQRALWWFGEARTLYMSVQGSSTPNLRGFRRADYDAILFDEATWELPAKNRALFQSSGQQVTLGLSNCNEKAYKVRLSGCALICCSNNFWAECPPEARDWIEANCYLVRITEPCWQLGPGTSPVPTLQPAEQRCPRLR